MADRGDREGPGRAIPAEMSMIRQGAAPGAEGHHGQHAENRHDGGRDRRAERA